MDSNNAACFAAIKGFIHRMNQIISFITGVAYAILLFWCVYAGTAVIVVNTKQVPTEWRGELYRNLLYTPSLFAFLSALWIYNTL